MEKNPVLAGEIRGSLDRELQDIFAALASTIAPTVTEIKSVTERVEQFPLASFIFLRLLRHNEHSSDEDALFAESLAYSTLQASSEFKHWLVTHQNKKHEAESAAEPLILTRKENILVIELNQPDTRNAYSTAMRDAFYDALSLLDTDLTIEKCVIKGTGECFCVGGDLTEFGMATDAARAHAIRSARNVALLLMKNKARIECQVHRACIGSGIELPAFAGRVVATEETFFQLPELSMGLIPGAGGTVSILRRIGRHRLAWWVLSGKKIKTETALEWGLIDEIV